VRTFTLCLGLLLALACFALLLGSAPAEASPSAAGTVDAGVCFDCHDLAEATASRFPHAPVVEGDCVACHNPHASRFAGLLMQRPGVLCADCHSETEPSAQRDRVHQPFADGKCNECHRPHGGDERGLLVEPTTALCTRCHAETGTWAEKPVRHVPVAQGRCGNCHEPHSANFDSLVKQEGARLCVTCHPASSELRSAHSGYPVESSSCTICHDPHASARQGLFRETLHEPFASRQCTSCHQLAGSSDPFALQAPVSQLCGECHGEQVAAAIEAPYPHVPAGGGACMACHNPHAGEGSAMLKSSTDSVCLSCHDPGGAKSGLPLRFTGHGEGISCSDCHEAHGGERPVLLRQESIELCGSCHTHEHSIRHPVGEETLDPRTGSSMTCLSCHSMHEPGYAMYLHGSDERDLCIGCHKEIGGGVS
jgi:predicted CXXCH cytochrome family protein